MRSLAVSPTVQGWTRRPTTRRLASALRRAAADVRRRPGRRHDRRRPGPARARPLDALAIVLVLAGPLALLWLRRNPVPVLWFVAAVTLVYLLRGYPYGPVFLSLASRRCSRRRGVGHRLAAWLAAGRAATSGTRAARRVARRGRGRGARSSASARGRWCCWSPARSIRVRRERASAAPAGPGRDRSGGRPTRSGCGSPASCTTSSPTTCR